MVCEGCNKNLDGIIAHVEHMCPTPKLTQLMDAPMRDEGELIITGGSYFHKAVAEAVKAHKDGFRFKE